MIRRILVPVLAIALSAFTYACKNEQAGSSAVASDTTSTNSSTDTGSSMAPADTSGTTASTGTVATGGTMSNVSDQDKEFVIKAAQGGMAEVTLGNLAGTNAASADVKSFAAKMVTDHGKANDELKQLALTKGLAVPSEPGKEHQDVIDSLTKKNGKDFDKAYMAAMVDDHDKTVKLFQDAAAGATDADIKAWAAKTLPTLLEHQKMAKSTKAALK